MEGWGMRRKSQIELFKYTLGWVFALSFFFFFFFTFSVFFCLPSFLPFFWTRSHYIALTGIELAL